MKPKIYFEDDFEKFETVFLNAVFNCVKICVVTDKNIAQIYMPLMTKIFPDKTLYYVCEPGEISKSIESAQNLYKFLIENNFSRSDILIAFGGGVVGDLTGFVAATYMRSIRFINIPTTLLAQTDSSIGGKNGINFNGVKNLIGTFYLPEIIYINTKLLSTLPAIEISNGMAEIIKHALLDKNFFEFITASKNISFDKQTLKRSVDIKLNMIKDDLRDKNNRRFLNLGHTFAHAIEAISKFEISHGQAVSLGIIFALFISHMRNLNHVVLEKTIELLKAYNLPIKISLPDKESVYEKMLCDKKFDNGKINIVLLNDIGNPIICSDVSKKEIFAAMHYLER